MPNAQFCTLGPFFSSGVIQGAAKLYHYSAGTSTLKNIWSDRAESTTLAQPFVADADGVFAFFADGLYKFIVVGPDSTGPSDDVLYTWDNFLIQDFLTPTFSEGTSITSASAIAVGPEIWAHVTGSTNIDTLSGTIPWVWLVFDGSLTLNHSASLLCPGSVSLTVQAGDVILLLNEGSSIWRIAGQMANSLLVNRTDVSVVVSDSRTNTVDAPLTITSTTSGTPAAGIGTGILLRAESQDENPSDFGQVAFIASDIGSGTEDTYCEIQTRAAGAALASSYRFGRTGTGIAEFTHANTATRSYGLPNATTNLIGHDTADTLSNKTIDSNGTGNVITIHSGALSTAAGNSVSSSDTAIDVTMNAYAFHPSITGTNTVGTVKPKTAADPSNTTPTFTVTAGSGSSVTTVRWLYISASDDPAIWVAIDNVTGEIKATWVSDDPVPGGVPGVTSPGCTSVLMKAQDLEHIAILNTKAADAAALIKSRKQKMQHQAYRALQLLTGDEAPAGWIIQHCEMKQGKLEIKKNGN